MSMNSALLSIGIQPIYLVNIMICIGNRMTLDIIQHNDKYLYSTAAVRNGWHGYSILYCIVVSSRRQLG